MHPKQILVVALQGLGNLVMTLPALAVLGSRPDRTRVRVLVPSVTHRDLLTGNPHVAEVLALDNGRLAPLVWRLRRLGLDACTLAFPSGPRSSLLSVASGARRRLAIRIPRNEAVRFLLTDVLDHDPEAHDRQANLQLAAHTLDVLGLSPTAVPTGPGIHLAPDEQQTARTWMWEHGVVDGFTVVGVAPGSGSGQTFKRWPLEHFRQACARLQEQRGDLKFLWFVGPDEFELLSACRKFAPAADHLVATGLPLRQTLGLLQGCALLLTNDNGVMHMAGALEVPVVAVFGPTDERRSGPGGPLDVTIAAELPCRPCYRFNAREFSCTQPVRLACLQGELSDTVVNAAASLANRRAGPAVTGRR